MDTWLVETGVVPVPLSNPCKDEVKLCKGLKIQEVSHRLEEMSPWTSPIILVHDSILTIEVNLEMA